MMDRLADRLDAAADALTTVDRCAPTLTVAAHTLAAGDTGVPGRIGRRLHDHWQAVLTARAHEAAAAAVRVAALAQAVRSTTRDYAVADESAADRVLRDR